MSDVAARPSGGQGEAWERGVERVFLIADVRGYTRFTREHGDTEAARLASRFAELARDAMEGRSGQVIELRGDEALAVFESASQAVRAATELAAVCSEEAAADDGLPLLVGVGIDLGEAVPVENGYRGAALNTAARLCSQAVAGQVLVTKAVAERAGDVPDVRFSPAGSFDLKGFEAPVELVEAIERLPGERGAVRSRPQTRLPLELETATPLAGRERERSWLRGAWRQALRGRGRLVVLSGPAGIGKTRLAAEIASSAGADGALVRYAGAGGTAAAVAAGRLGTALREASPTLLVLDDLDPIAELLAPALVDAADVAGHRPLLIVCLLRNPQLGPPVEKFVHAADRDGDGHRELGPLDVDGIKGIAAPYAPDDVESVPLESIARASGGVPARVHELTSEWAQAEASRRLTAAAEFLAVERHHRQADLDFANNVIGLKLARLYAGDGVEPDVPRDEAPYKGLASFEERDAALFFGREQLVGELAARTVATGLLAVVGASGSGKSSVIAAGLLPSLRAGLLPGSERWQAAVTRPGERPLSALADLPANGDRERLVVVVDQFEEVFTLCRDEVERTAFVGRLAAMASDPASAVVVIGLRGDYYGHCGAYPELARLLGANQVLVGPMSPDELRRAIELPARRSGVRVESSLVDALVEEIGDEAGGLPLLSTALVELWRERDDDWLRLATSERLGGLHGAVARLADSSYENLTNEEREATRRLFLRLATSGEEGALARRRVPLSELDLDRDPVLANVVARLTADRLLTADGSSVEVAHEALLREWPRFQGWLAEDTQGRELREHLTDSAKRWDAADRDPAELYRGARLTATLDWAAGRQRELNEREREFMKESRRHSELEAERERRQNRRLRGLLVGAAVLLLAAVAGGAVALQQRSSAQHEATVALGRQLGAEAVSESRIDLAMLLARESLNLDRSLQTEGTLLTTLLRAPLVTGSFSLPITDRPLVVRASPDGRSIAVGTNNQITRFYDTRTFRELRKMPLTGALGSDAYVRSTGDLFGPAAGSLPAFQLVDPRRGGTLGTYTLSKLWQTKLSTPVEPAGVTRDGRYGFVVWSLVTPSGIPGATYAETWALRHPGPSRLVPLHATGVVAATATARDRVVIATDGRILTLNLATRRRVAAVPGPRFGAKFVNAGISGDGRTLAYGLANGSVHFFHLATGTSVTGTEAHSAPVQSIEFSPDSRLAVSTGDDGLAIVWKTATATPVHRLTGHSLSRVIDADFSSDGKTLYTASLDGTILRYDLGRDHRYGSGMRTGPPAPNAGGPAGAPITPALAISPDGRTLAAATLDPMVNLYSTGTLRRLATIAVPAGLTANAVAWAGSRLVLGSGHGIVQVWDATGATPKLVTSLKGFSGNAEVRAVATADGGRVVAAVDGYPGPRAGGPPAEKGQFALWRDGRRIGRTMDLHTFGNGIAMSADGSTVAVATDDLARPVLVIDARTGRVERILHPSTGAITVAFGSGDTLASGAGTGIVNLWDASTGKAIGHSTLVAPAPVAAIAFAPGGRTFATSGGSSGQAKIWVTATQQQLGSDFPGGAGTWTNVAYTPDGRELFAAFGNGTAYRWPATVSAWEQHACAVAGRSFTREEWARFVGSRPYAAVCP
jgi:class 3 adenylate cyclase/WD40 repeat protein